MEGVPGSGSLPHTHHCLSPPSPWHKEQKCKTLAGSPRIHSSPAGQGARRAGNWQGCSGPAPWMPCAIGMPDGAALRLLLLFGGTMSRAGLGVQETQLLSPLRCQGCVCLCGGEETGTRERPVSPEPTKPWCKLWQVTDKLGLSSRAMHLVRDQ